LLLPRPAIKCSASLIDSNFLSELFVPGFGLYQCDVVGSCHADLGASENQARL
jgi:hypothetical protein